MGADRFEVEVRDSVSLERLYPPLRMDSVARCSDFSQDGKALAVGSDDGSAYVWDLETGQALHPRLHHTGWVKSVHFSPDGRRLLTSSDDGTAKVWSLARESESAAMTLPASLGVNRFWDTVPRGRTPGPIPITLKDGAVHLVDPERLMELASLQPQEPGARLHVWSGGLTGRFWAIAEGKGKDLDDGPEAIDLWEQRSNGVNCLRLPHPKGVAFMTFAADDSRLVTFCRDWSVRVWRTSDGQLESAHPVPKNYYYGNVTHSQGGSYWFRPDGGAMLLYLDLKDERKPGEPPSFHEQLFDPFKGEWIGTPYNPYLWAGGNINKMGFSPDGSRLAIVTTGQSGHVFDLRLGGQESVHFKHGGDLLDLDWSPDGKRLLTAGLAPEVKVWDAATGAMVGAPLRIGTKPARAGLWSADGRFIVTRSDEQFARVWDAATTEAVTPLLRHTNDIRWVCITPNNRLITASDPNLLRAWDLKPTTLPVDVIADYAKLLSGRRLSPSGALLPLRALELADLASSLRTKAPELFK
jgi:WD40 repeat protein